MHDIIGAIELTRVLNKNVSKTFCYYFNMIDHAVRYKRKWFAFHASFETVLVA